MRHLIVGDLMVDVLTSLQDEVRFGDDNRAVIEFTGGGVCANVAAWMARDGERPVLFCAIGPDVIGAALVSDLERAGVTVRAVQTTTPTGAVVALVHPNGERTMFPSAGANAQLPMEIMDLDVHQGDHVHVSGYFILRDHSRSAALHYIAMAKQRGATVSLDPASARLIEVMGAAAALRAMRGVDLLICNQQESLALSGASSHIEAARRLADHFPTAIVKLGAEGACSWREGRLVVDRVDATNVVSTVGAGDAFDAGAILAWKRGEDVKSVLSAGNRNGRLAVQQRGARPV